VSPERWRKIESLFNDAADLPPEQRESHLDSACGGDPELRKEVCELLSASSPGLIESAVEATVGDMAARAADDSMVGNRIGAYRIAALVGRGGMGAVYRAVRDDDEYHRQVAIKVVPRLLASPEAVARFRSERQILANLDHPNIARLLDGGTSDGIPFLVMEYVEGVPVTQYASDRNLSIEQRLELMGNVCGAVQYAHRNLIVHRDLKPANILVTADGIVKLLDFGVAKLVDPVNGGTANTLAMMLTPDYASPEQVRGETVTTASDVYSLGVVLYEVLTGTRPYEVTTANAGEMQRIICLTEPPAPSKSPKLHVRLRRQLSGDLDNIVLMAMRKDAARRYGSAEQLAADMQRHLDGRPVAARSDTLAYRCGKFVQRNRWALSAGVLIAGILITATITAVREARESQRRFDQLRGFARTVLVDLDAQLRDIPGTAKARQLLISDVDGFLKNLAAENGSDDAALAAELATTYLRMGEMQGSTPEALRSFENGRRLMEGKLRRKRSLPADKLVLARLNEHIGVIMTDLGRPPEAIENLTRAATLAESARSSGEWNPEAQQLKARADWRLARLYRTLYQLDEAETHGKQAIADCQDLMARGIHTKALDEIFTGARLVLAGVYRRQGKWNEGLGLYEQVLADAQRRADSDPQSVALQRELVLTHQIVADMLNLLPERRKEVPAHIHASVRIAERLSSLDPTDATLRGELGQALSSAGEFLDHRDEFDESMQYLKRSLSIFESLLLKAPDSGVYLLYASLVEAVIGKKLADANSNAEGLRWMRLGRARLEKLVQRDPKNYTHRLELQKVQRWMVESLSRLNFAREAIALAEATVASAREVAAQAAPGQTFTSREVPRSCAALAKAYRLLGKNDEARRWYAITFEEWARLKKGKPPMPDEKEEIEEARKWSGN
jgi:tetratricopeptide (TPR) repeat protein